MSYTELSGGVAAFGGLGRDFGRMGRSFGSLVGASNSTPGLITATDTAFYAANGCTWPKYGAATTPSDIYVASTKKLWTVWQEWNGTVRRCFVKTCDLTDPLNPVWSPQYLVGNDALSDDDHGVYSICRQPNGTVRIAGGAHGASALQTWYTATPDDPSSFVAGTAIGTAATYPHFVTDANDIYIFYRESRNAGDNNPMVYYKVSSPPAGDIASWGTSTTVVDYGANSRVDFGNVLDDGTNLNVTAVYVDAADTFRVNVYWYKIVKATGAVVNFSGSVSTAAVSLPLSKATSDASYIVVNQGAASHFGNTPSIALDLNTKWHLGYLDGPSGGPYNYMHTWSSDGITFAAPDTVGAFPSNNALHRFDNGGLIATETGTVIATWVTASAFAFTRGGDISQRVWTAGAFGAQTLVQAARSTNAMDAPSAVLNGTSKCRYSFYETAGQSITESGFLRVFMRGDTDFLRRPFQTLTNSRCAAILTASGVAPTDQHKEAIDEMYQWIAAYDATTFDTLRLAWAANKQESYIDWMDATKVAAEIGGGPTWANGTWTSNGTTQKLDTGFNPSLHAVRGALNDNGYLVRVTSAAQVDTLIDFGVVETGVSIMYLNSNYLTGNGPRGANCNNTSFVGTVASGGIGWWSIERTSSILSTFFKTGVAQGTSAAASVSLPNASIHICGTNIAQFSSRPIAAAAWGKSRTGAQRSNFLLGVSRYIFAQ